MKFKTCPDCATWSLTLLHDIFSSPDQLLKTRTGKGLEIPTIFEKKKNHPSRGDIKKLKWLSSHYIPLNLMLWKQNKGPGTKRLGMALWHQRKDGEEPDTDLEHSSATNAGCDPEQIILPVEILSLIGAWSWQKHWPRRVLIEVLWDGEYKSVNTLLAKKYWLLNNWTKMNSNNII
jgi:hypothetical protein